MLPKELRAFRESLGLSRREFAPKLLISEGRVPKLVEIGLRKSRRFPILKLVKL